MKQSLDVFFRGSRPYIQGSLILSQAAVVAQQWWQATTLSASKFSEIVESSVWVSDEKSEADSFGEATFSDGQGNNHRMYFFIDSGTPPPRHPDRGSCLTQFETDGDLNTRSEFEIEPNPDDLLAAIVETTKTAHEKLPGDIRDVWFTGFRGADIPISPERIAPSGAIHLECRMHRGKGQQYQTLFAATVESADGEYEFLLSFAYKNLASEN